MESTVKVLTECPICAGVEIRYLFSKGGSDFVRCAGCGLVYLHPQPTDDALRTLYSADYYEPWGLATESDAVREMKISTFDDKLAMVELHATKTRILDIGCATGFFLEVAKRRGWDVYGVEISSYSANLAKTRFGNSRVFNGSLDAAMFANGFFDVVFMSDLLEHIKDLHVFLNEVRRILKGNGIIAVVTPDLNSFSRRLMGRFWPHFKAEHLYYFSLATLDALLRKYGFHTVTASSASKTLTLAYAERQLSAYPIPLITPLVKATTACLPSIMRNRMFRVATGELFLLAEKVL